MTRPFCPQACPTADCNKKVIEEGDNNYRCEKCNKTYPNFQYRLILSVSVIKMHANICLFLWIACMLILLAELRYSSCSNLFQVCTSFAHLQHTKEAIVSTYIYGQISEMSRCHSGFGPPRGFGPPGPDPLADLDPLSRIWTPLKISVLLSKTGKIVFGAVKGQNKNIKTVFFFSSNL